MLDAISYKTNILNKKVLENSIGNGNIMLRIVDRYINCAIEANISSNDIKKGLEKYIFGYETDSKLLDECINRVNSLALHYGLVGIHWNFFNEDALKST